MLSWLARQQVLRVPTRTLARYYGAKRPAPHPSESFLRGTSAVYVEEMFNSWKENPASVHKSWDAYFKAVERGARPGEAYVEPPTLRGGAIAAGLTHAPMFVPTAAPQGGIDTNSIVHLIRAYQVRGHNVAKLDPLGINEADLDTSIPKELDYKSYGFTEQDLDKPFSLSSTQFSGFLGHDKPTTLRELLARLESTYCNTIGIQYMHIKDRDECNWIRERIENGKPRYSVEDKKVILDRLMWGDLFELYIAKKWTSEKRFGLDGCEALIPAMKALIDRAADLGTENIVMGMPHRGRLNVLSNVVRKPNEAIFNEFSGSMVPEGPFSGDVKYHLGMNFNRPTRSGKMIHLSLVANPSHLEAVNPVVMGKTRALQYSKDSNRDKCVALLLHGDAAFAGQGVVYESLGMTNLPNYTTGGVIHIVVNNQIGFTTDPRFSRSTPYCTDIALSLEAPVLHVNADDVEAVVFAAEFAADYRHTFHRDVVLDLVCYRRLGHNEVDQPMFTQPLMYKHIQKHKRVAEIYKNKLIEEGTITAEEAQAMHDRIWKLLDEAFERSKTFKPDPTEWITSNWMVEGFKSIRELLTNVVPERFTGVPMDALKHIGTSISTVPEGFKLHESLVKVMRGKLKTIETGTGVDMPTAEGLAFGSLLMEKIHVRLSGQDVERGTFSHRHAVLVDQDTEQRWVQLNNLSHDQEKMVVTNSHLSEYGVLGFELGYSLVNPNSLVLWEAQFGDFCNTAQCIIDQFIASGETKWYQRTGLVVLLPHGYDGAGPEHSSGRMERFLQLCGDNPEEVPEMADEKRRQIQDCNLQVVYPSTPANYFHVLRRQIHRDFRKPLIVFNSKSLLRHPDARSSLDEFVAGTKFRRLIPDTGDHIGKPEDVRRVIFCSGQVYYLLNRVRAENNFKDVAIARVEQISPFPYDLVAKEAEKFPNAQIVWAQEEPMNAGAWTYVQPRIRSALNALSQAHRGKEATYAGRAPSAATATGLKKQHIAEERELISRAFFGDSRQAKSYPNNVPIYN